MQAFLLYKNILILCLCFLISEKNFSQGKTIHDLFPFPAFEKITTDQGLSNNEVYQVMQDKQGFVWLLTGNGLNRFDGYFFKIMITTLPIVIPSQQAYFIH